MSYDDVEDYRALLRQGRLVDRSDLPSVRIRVLRTYTTELLTEAVDAWLALLGIHALIETLPYGQLSEIANCDEAIVAIDPQDLHPDMADFLTGQSADGLSEALQRLSGVTPQLATSSCHVTMLGSFVSAVESIDLDGSEIAGSGAARGRQWNEALRDWTYDAVRESSFVDLRSLGVTTDSRSYARSLQPFDSRSLFILGRLIARQIAARRLPRTKCVVVDADGTLWGGVIGEDGLDGIALGLSGDGRHFRDFQRQLRTLRNRGFLLAIASKNERADVLAVLERHPARVLTPDDFVAIECGWDPKHVVIERIAGELGLGLDSFVFVDDSDLECELVAEFLPAVQTRQVPTDAWKLTSLLGRIPSLDVAYVTDEDVQRTEMYKAEVDRSKHAAGRDYNSFLADLEVRVVLSPVGRDHLDRSAQLIGKTNQANLSLRRRSRSEPSELLEQADVEGWVVDVSDRFGPYGSVGLLLLDSGGDELEIDTMLLSCRVLGRGVEQALLAHASERARALGRHVIVADYVRGERNQLVADLLPSVGFESKGDDGVTIRYGIVASESIECPPWLDVTTKVDFR